MGSISKVLDPVVLAVAVPMQDFVALRAGAVERCCHQSMDVDSLSVQEYSLVLRPFVSDRFQQLPGFAGFVSFTSAAWLVYQRSVQAADPSVAARLVLSLVPRNIFPDFFSRNNLRGGEPGFPGPLQSAESFDVLHNYAYFELFTLNFELFT